jgi:hypothetical protein
VPREINLLHARTGRKLKQIFVFARRRRMNALREPRGMGGMLRRQKNAPVIVACRGRMHTLVFAEAHDVARFAAPGNTNP